MKPLVIYHDHCTDGFGAAFAAWLKFGDEAEYFGAQYSDDRDVKFWTNEDGTFDSSFTILNREIYILDFSYNRWVMEGLFATAKRVVWLDHHKTAFEMWCGKYEKGMRFADTNGCYGDGKHDIVLNDNKSGALLAWEWFHGTEVPMLIQHIDDRDRWQFKLEGSKELHAYLASIKPWTPQQWVGVNTSIGARGKNSTVFAEGAAILRAQNAAVISMAKQARKCAVNWQHGTFKGLDTGLAVNAIIHQSEVGHELATQSGTYGLVWYLGQDGRVKASLRSNGDYDVSAIAKSFGGGGHRNAAGFETEIETLMVWLK